ncbi:MAG: hypothetical protein R3A46_19525 [Thermomicrobiales bacterium]
MIGLLEIRRRKLQFTLIAAVFALVAYLVLMITGLGIGLSELAGSALLNLDANTPCPASTGLLLSMAISAIFTVDQLANDAISIRAFDTHRD